LLAFVMLTVAEVMVSITCLEFSYTQAPKKMKSLIMGLYLLSIALGNAFTAGVNFCIENRDGTSKLPGASYYWFFAGLMLATTLLFCVYAAFYREKTYIQDDAAGNSR
jgi:proton-dependent oligopeptide transporter, POT family